MISSNNKLRHLPFFEEIASRDEGTREWHSATAGLVVLRLVDTWLENALPAGHDNDWSMRSVRCSIEAVNEGTPVRVLLDRVIDALQEQKPDIHVVISPLMAYAQALEYDAQWLLAADVYQSVLAHLHPVEDGDASVAAQIRLGTCYRNLNQIDAALAAYSTASQIAAAAGDMVGVLRARIGEARVAILRGNLPHAEHLLADTISHAQGPEFREVRAGALHERSAVATLSGKYEFGIRLAYDALGLSESPTAKDRILSDIAGAFFYLGIWSAARDAYLVLSVTAQEQYMRWTSTLNLMEIAAHVGAQPQFDQHRRQLVGQHLPPQLATNFELIQGLGYRQFGNPDAARLHLERAVALAGEHGFDQLLTEAREAMRQLETVAPTRHVEGQIPLDVEDVALAIRSLRESVKVS
ncbi:MAG: hypothetical protein ACRENU_13100 [Gemmatimonadaceae bacterium]